MKRLRRTVVAGIAPHTAVPPGARDAPPDYRLKIGNSRPYAVVVDVPPNVLDVEHDGRTGAAVAVPVLTPALVPARHPRLVTDSSVRSGRRRSTEHGYHD